MKQENWQWFIKYLGVPYSVCMRVLGKPCIHSWISHVDLVIPYSCPQKSHHHHQKNARLWRRLKLKPSLSPSISGLKTRFHCEDRQEIYFDPSYIAKIEIWIHDSILQPGPSFIATVNVILYCSKGLWRKFSTVPVFVGPYIKPSHRGLFYAFYPFCEIP